MKLKGIQSAIRNISKLKDPIDVTLHKWRRPNGLIIKKNFYTYRCYRYKFMKADPNVTSDASSLCFKSGNAVILRGGSEAFNTNKILANLFRTALKENKVDPNYVTIYQ